MVLSLSRASTSRRALDGRRSSVSISICLAVSICLSVSVCLSLTLVLSLSGAVSVQSINLSSGTGGYCRWRYPVQKVSANTTLCRVTGVTLHGVVSPDCPASASCFGRVPRKTHVQQTLGGPAPALRPGHQPLVGHRTVLFDSV